MSDRTTISISKAAAESLKATADMFGITQSQLVEELALGLNLNRNALTIVKTEFGKVSFSELINNGVEPLVAKADALRSRRAYEELFLVKASETAALLTLDVAMRAALAANVATWSNLVSYVYANYTHLAGSLDSVQQASEPEFVNHYYYENALLLQISKGKATIRSNGEIMQQLG